MKAARTSRERRHAGAANRGRQRGSALAELVLTVPIFVACIYGSQYLTELGTAKLEAQEIARYATWAFAVQPLADEQSFRHDDAFDHARDTVARELVEIYAPDMDGAGDGARAEITLAAVYEPPTESDLRNARTSLLASWADVSLAGDATPLGRALEQVGASKLGAISGMLFDGLGLNVRGQVTGRARVRLSPPARPVDARRGAAVAGLAARGGMDGLRDLVPAGTELYDEPGRPMQNTILADPWRITQGWTATPDEADEARSYYANAVRKVASALDLFELVAGLLHVEIPDEVEAAVGKLASPRVLSRPYTAGRGGRPSVTSRGPLEAGQVDIFAATGSEPQEPGAARRFETMPLYYDPDDVDGSEYLKLLNLRGDNFLGCTASQARECWQ